MEGDPARYGERIADVYDELYGALFDADAAAECLADLAAGKRALELGVGTGRVALPLAALGVDVTGIDVSVAMVERMRAKPGAGEVRVVMGDMAHVDVDGSFGLVFVVFNTFFALTTQQDQLDCFHNVAQRLVDDGVFVIEAFVPDPCRFDEHQRVAAERVFEDRVMLEVSRHDPVRQRVSSRHVVVGEDGTRVYPVELRYAWPSELDLMARLGGLRLRDRWGGWDRSAFTSESRIHVSVYERAASPAPGRG